MVGILQRTCIHVHVHGTRQTQPHRIKTVQPFMLVIFASGLGFSCGFNIDQDYVNEFHFVVLLWNSNAKKMQHVQRTQHNQWPGKGLYVIKWQTKINKQNEKN